MACIPNINNILNLDFAIDNDIVNWTTNSTNVINQTGGTLNLNPSSSASIYDRNIGIPDPTNNRIRLRTNFQLDASLSSGSPNVDVLFELIVDNVVIHSSCATFENVVNDIYNFNIDRTYVFDTMPTTPIKLRIYTINGWQYIMRFEDLVVEDFNFCQDNIRTYFVLADLFTDAQTAMSSGIVLNSWKINDVETLTPLFFSENPTFGGNPIALWLFANASLDGSNRISDTLTPNSFNPFYDEWGMDFVNVLGNYFGGKTIGSISGSDYGNGITQIGIDKPTIINGAGETKSGAFFIDLDYEQNFEIQFDVLINAVNSNIYVSPYINRSYTIQFDAETCITTFQYVDNLNGATIDESLNGFLYGITEQEQSDLTVVDCNVLFAPSSPNQNTVFEIDFGNDIGNAVVNYNAFGIPDRFILDWDGNIQDSGFVGLDAYDTDLINAGVAPIDINTTPLGNGEGSFLFNKTTATPNKATITVLSPLDPTGWNVKAICVGDSPPLCQITTSDSPSQVDEILTFNLSASDLDGTIATWNVDFGDGNDQSGVGVPPPTVTHSYSTIGLRVALLTVFDNDGNGCQDKVNVGIIKSTSGGGGFRFVNEQENNCYSCLQFAVEPLTGTYTIQTISNFQTSATYATNAPTGCYTDPTDGTLIAIDTTINVTVDTLFFIGIDSAQNVSGNTDVSSITVIVRDNTNAIVGTYVLAREHVAVNC